MDTDKFIWSGLVDKCTTDIYYRLEEAYVKITLGDRGRVYGYNSPKLERIWMKPGI